MNVDVLSTSEGFTITNERRGIYAVKKYLHRWATYQGEDVFLKFRKKHNRTYKEVCHHQHLVDEMKPLFGLKKIGTRVVYDEVETWGVMQKWWPVIGTVKQREFMPQWVSEAAWAEVLKICIFDGVIGGLDRHGNNVLVLQDKSLLTIDDEDVFYDKLRVWVKFDKDIKTKVYLNYLKHQDYFAKYVQVLRRATPRILEVADHPVMHDNEQYPFYKILRTNLDNIEDIAQETIRQLLL